VARVLSVVFEENNMSEQAMSSTDSGSAPYPAGQTTSSGGQASSGGVYYEGVGRRKRATARVRLYADPKSITFAGQGVQLGEVVVNGKPAQEYFPRHGDFSLATEPLQAAGLSGTFFVSVLVRGGGVTGQVGAVRHGLARALLKSDPELRPAMRKGGFLTRDARIKERKKPGLKRARKAPQYTKR
jgi:small subunit ribosomal protein S9